jgi:hypothetical protein
MSKVQRGRSVTKTPITIFYSCELRGSYEIDGETITARSADGRTKSTKLRGRTPQTLAEIMLRELADDRLGVRRGKK